MAEYKTLAELTDAYNAGTITKAEFDKRRSSFKAVLDSATSALKTLPGELKKVGTGLSAEAGKATSAVASATGIPQALQRERDWNAKYETRTVPSASGFGTTEAVFEKATGKRVEAPKPTPAAPPAAKPAVSPAKAEDTTTFAPPSSSPTTVAPERGTSSGRSWSSTAYSEDEFNRVGAGLRALGIDPNAGFDSSKFEIALDKLEEESAKRDERIDRAELAAKLGHAIGLMIAGGGAGKIGKFIGSKTTKGIGEVFGSGLGSQGAGEYTGEMLKAPTPDMEKQRDRAEASRSAREKTIMAQQQTAYNSWRDRMDQALRMADISRVSKSGSTQESDRPAKSDDSKNLKQLYMGLIQQPKSKDDTAATTTARDTALAQAGIVGPDAEFLKTNQGTSDFEIWDKPKREKILKRAAENLKNNKDVPGELLFGVGASAPAGGAKAGEDEAAQAAEFIRTNPKDPRVKSIKTYYNLQ